MINPNPIDYGWWLASRSAGVIAIVAISFSVLLGLSMANNLIQRPGFKGKLLKVHESTALIGLVAIAVHALALLGDHWLHPTISQLLIPFQMSFKPFFTGLGIIGGWLAVILGLSFYVRKRVGTKLWRKLHRATFLVWVLAVAHALGSGTDASELWLQAIILITGLPILALLALRIKGGRPRKATPRPEPQKHIAPRPVISNYVEPVPPLPPNMEVWSPNNFTNRS